ncbi:hypothetical protein GJ631_17145 [Natronomonas sp. CBA1123]|uniref:hypothetical protein n=1 Tax=Natronomonas sp. CBA1123 TaxID=2668070 RepID=UPI0012EAD559|nr:hypothetical protein [Natronomonas sp. CBA1123]MUV88233.1 hypothetical protein [Natronomonas sp. CBA1123]
MVEWAAAEDCVCGFGDDDSVEIGVSDWQLGGDPSSLPAATDAVVVGTTTRLGLPADAAVFVASAGDRLLEPDALPAGRHHLRVAAPVESHLAFDGPATVVDAGDGFGVEFPEPTAVAVGFREARTPRPTVTVPKTPAGLATAVTAAGGTHRTTGPARSHPGFRPRTPRVTFGKQSIPAELRDRSPAATVTVPPSTRAVLIAAPLTYYLGGELRVAEGVPHIESPELSRTFEPLPAFADTVAEWLRRLCTLDSRLRSVPGESGAMSVDGYDAETLRSAPATARLRAALEASSPTLPQWPLSTYVDETVENGRYLPYVLDRLSLVHPAESSALDPKALLKRSLDEFYRGESPNVEAVDPTLSESRFHAWLADGTPVDAYTLLGAESGRRPPTEGLTVDVVCNDADMASEQAVASVYRRRLTDHDVSVRVHEGLQRRELAAVFEGRTDLVHFIGHVETDGLVCPDGTLAATDLDECGAAAFFLNACGSYYEGYDLVRQGAIVGATTLTAVLDEQAVRLGTTFAELLAAGYSFDRALSMARREIIVGRDYVVVGDGTHRLRQPTGQPATLDIQTDGEAFTVRYDVTAPDSAGRRYAEPFDGEERLAGTSATTTLERGGLRELLSRHSVPVRYDGDLVWATELAERLGATRQHD